MRLPWHREISDWAQRNGSVREIWLFGSRADELAIPNKDDVDLAIVLMPPIVRSGREPYDWAAGNYERFGDDWQRELAAIVGGRVDLVLYDPNVIIKATRIWQRAST